MPLTARQRSIHAKNGAKRTTSFNRGKTQRKSLEGEYLVTNAPTDLKNIFYPGGALALVLLMVVGVASALWGIISDCDETYNYWEPLHYLVYGTGLQTWEYSPKYAIRSYAALWLFAIPAKMLSWVFAPVTVFYIIRVSLGILTAASQLLFYKAICHEFGVHIGRVWLALTVLVPGTFVSSAALLPSACGNMLSSAALACWWKRRYPAAVVLTAANTLLGWPFTALLGLPIAIDMIIIKQRVAEFIKWAVISLLLILIPTVAIDWCHYGRLVVAPWNIIAYNIFTEHGPDLYGVEPITYYLLNAFLNFNFVCIYSVLCIVLLPLCSLVTPNAAPRPSFCNPYWLSLLPFYLWIVIFTLQPHKEERFLYPVYSQIVLTAAISLDCVQKMVFAIGTELLRWRRPGKRHYLAFSAPIMYCFLLMTAGASISRTLSLYNNYSGPMRLLQSLPTTSSSEYVCFGKDWYRSPSSFHLPTGYEVRFVQSEFDGQMPAPYSKFANATRIIQPHFNDMNKGDNRTYLSPDQCHYLVDSDLGRETSKQPFFYKQKDKWNILNSVPLIDAEKSDKIFRAFYVPILSNKLNTFGNLYLLQNKRFNA